MSRYINLLERFASISESLEVVSGFDTFNVENKLFLEILSPKELEICSGFTSLKRKYEFISGRFACKKAFCELIEGVPFLLNKFPSISIINTDKGAPFVEKMPDLHVSISHSHKVAIASICKRAVGIDIEKIDPKKIQALKRMSPEIQSKCVFELTAIWTLKESLSKALRTGIVKEFRHYEIENLTFEDRKYLCDFKNFPFHGIAIFDSLYAIGIVAEKP